MQEKKMENDIFRDRTDRLAVKLDMNIGDLPKIIGISSARIYAYRSGAAAISGKAWKKLEMAEEKAGIHSSIKSHYNNIKTADDLMTFIKLADPEDIEHIPYIQRMNVVLGLAGAFDVRLKDYLKKIGDAISKSPEIEKGATLVLGLWEAVYDSFKNSVEANIKFNEERENDPVNKFMNMAAKIVQQEADKKSTMKKIK